MLKYLRVRNLFIAVLILQSFESFSQRQTYQAKDGTSVDLEVLSSNPDEGRNASIYLGFFGPEGMHNVGASYHQPAKFYLNVLAGRTGANLDGSFFLFSTLKPTKIKQSVKQDYNTRYVVKIPAEKRRSFGIHIGVSSVDYSKMTDAPASGLSAKSVFGGLSLLKSKHTHWKIYDDYRQAQGTAINRLNADVIYYFDRSAVYLEPGETLDDASRKMGVRLYYDGKATFWSRAGRMGLNYMLGVALNSDMDGIPLFAGIGLGYNFL
jgi:hypothetical protein